MSAILGNEVDFVNVSYADAHLLPFFVKHMTTEVGTRSLLGSTPYENVHPTLLSEPRGSFIGGVVLSATLAICVPPGALGSTLR